MFGVRDVARATSLTCYQKHTNPPYNDPYLRTTVKSGSITLQKRRSVKLLD